MNQTDFLEKFETYSDDEIFKIINTPEDYNTIAVDVATQIAIKRKLLSDEKTQDLKNQSVEQWHYEINGSRQGPVSENQLIELFKQGDIEQSTVIWRKGLDNWTELYKSELKKIIPSNIPPPLLGSKVNNNFVWILAFAPIIGIFAQAIVAGFILQSRGFTSDNSYFLWNTLVNTEVSKLWWITVALNILLCVLDERKLNSAGHNTNKFSGFWLILIPVYLFKRANHLNQTPTYAWLWIVSFVASFFVH